MFILKSAHSNWNRFSKWNKEYVHRSVTPFLFDGVHVIIRDWYRQPGISNAIQQFRSVTFVIWRKSTDGEKKKKKKGQHYIEGSSRCFIYLLTVSIYRNLLCSVIVIIIYRRAGRFFWSFSSLCNTIRKKVRKVITRWLRPRTLAITRMCWTIAECDGQCAIVNYLCVFLFKCARETLYSHFFFFFFFYNISPSSL